MFSKETIAKLVEAAKGRSFTDLVIVCDGGEETDAHKIIVCTQSPVLFAACTGSYKEASGRYRIRDSPHAMVQRLVDYWHEGAYDVTAPGLDDNHQVAAVILSAHATMFALGDKYQVDGLMKLAANNYQAALQKNPNARAFLHSLDEVYKSTPDHVRGLRQIAVCFAKDHLAASLVSPETKKMYNEVAERMPEFIKDLADSYLEQSRRRNWSDCSGAEPAWLKKHRRA